MDDGTAEKKDVHGILSFDGFMEIGKRYEKDLSERYDLYEELKERGLIVKTGFKYGAYFRAYEDDPDENHAMYLFHFLSGNGGKTWPDISRSVRVAHGVRKKMIFAFREEDTCCRRDEEMDTTPYGGERKDPEEMKFLLVERVKPSC